MRKEHSLPTYQINLPAQVRFDPKLSAHAKLLYGEIKVLCHKEGYCWASNRFLASLYGVDRKVISRWVQQLEKQKHIQVEIVKSKGNVRKIFLLDYHFKSGYYPQKSETSPPKKDEVSTKKEGGVDLLEDTYLLKNDSQSPLLLIDNIIDYNDRIYRINNVSTKKRIGNKTEEFGEEKNKEEGNYSSGNAQSPQVAPPPLPQKETEKGSATFVRPSVKEVEDHMLGQNEICADAMTARGQALRFVNYYESNGWKVGRNAMQDWQASANNWLLNSQNYTTSKSSTHERLHTTRNKDYSIPL